MKKIAVGLAVVMFAGACGSGAEPASDVTAIAAPNTVRLVERASSGDSQRIWELESRITDLESTITQLESAVGHLVAAVSELDDRLSDVEFDRDYLKTDVSRIESCLDSIVIYWGDQTGPIC